MSQFFKLPAFSLLETALSLIIMGITLSIFIPFAQKNALQRKKVETLEKQKLIIQSLAHYKKTSIDHTLPCPADPFAVGSEFGKSLKSCERKDGIIPFQTLGLQLADVQDGYGRFFTYACDPNMVESEGRGSSSLAVEEVEAGGKKYNPPDVVAVIVSHGPKGYGSYHKGGTIPSVSSAKNSNHTLSFEITPFASEHIVYLTYPKLLSL